MSERDPDGQVSVEVRGRVLLVGIDRPEKLNGLTPKMFWGIAAAYERLDEEEDLRAGVLFAHGKHFTAGLDLPKFGDDMRSGERKYLEGRINGYGLNGKCRKPIVCAVQGYTFTAGVEFMLACDIVVAASDAQFSQMEPKRGIMATGGATMRLVERCGWGNAMYHLLRCDVWGAEEAYRIGLVQEVVEPGAQVDRAIEIAEEIASFAPLAVQATKASSRLYVEEGEAAVVAAYPATQKRLSNTEDAAEGVASFKEKRDPVFKGR